MDFSAFLEGGLQQSLVNGLWEVDRGMHDSGPLSPLILGAGFDSLRGIKPWFFKITRCVIIRVWLSRLTNLLEAMIALSGLEAKEIAPYLASLLSIPKTLDECFRNFRMDALPSAEQ